MRLPRPSPYQFLSGFGSLGSAYLLAVGSGLNVEVEHDLEVRLFGLVALIMALGGVALLLLSLRLEARDP